MRRLSGIIMAFAWMAIIPSALYAQGSIAGAVRDTSGAVLPGVTIEASSPALIEKTRSVVTDGTGQYRIVDLRPGMYTVTFTLAGFSVVKREGIELTGSFTATVNAEMRVGALEETVTVTGETPIVDIQNTTRQRAIAHDIIDAVPTGRIAQNLGVLVPGVTIAASLSFTGVGGQDVGGSSGNMVQQLAAHGGRGLDTRTTLNGLSVNLSSSLNNTPYVANMGSTQEVTIDVSGVSAEATEGGVRMNLIPKEGGNTFRWSSFGSFANESMQGSNFTSDLKARGLTNVNTVKKVGEFNPAFGGPIAKDTLWFFTAYKLQVTDNYVAGMYFDTTYNDPKAFSLNLDPSHRVSNDALWNEGDVNLTWQATTRNKFGFTYQQDHMCTCPGAIRATTSPGISAIWGSPHHVVTASWTSTLTNRLLLEAGVLQQTFRWLNTPLPGTNPDVIQVSEQSTGITYKLRGNTFWDRRQHDLRYRVALSYITGAHAFKIGFNTGSGDSDTYNFLNGNRNVNYRLNTGIPNLITEFATPFHDLWNLDHDLGLYAQDKWTVGRLTLNGGVRFDAFKSRFPEYTFGSVPYLAPTRNFTLPDETNTNWKDATPRMGAAYDVFGTGKTAFKVSLNKYLLGADGPAFTYGANATGRVVLSTTRSWRDANGSFTPECDLTSTLANGECGALADPNFGNPVVSTHYDPNAIIGWGKRQYDWEFATSVQQQIVRQVSVEAGFFRRWYGNFAVTDNLSLSAPDLDSYCIPAPVDGRLPGGGGNQICGLYNVTPAKFSVPANNFVTEASNYGKQIEHWNGVDVSFNARLARGLTLQGGVSTGRTSTDNCAIVTPNPDLLYTATTATPLSYCHVDTLFLTQVKALSSYVFPKVDIQVGGSFQSVPGPAVIANYNAPNSVVTPSLGRPLAGGAANVTVNLVPPGTMYGDRVNQVDLRVGKIFRFGQRRASLNLDIYNALNSSAVQGESQAYGTFRLPQLVMMGHFVKVSTQWDF